MDRNTFDVRVWVGLLAVAALALLAVLASNGALADPENTDEAPTEDWLFDSGAAVVLSYAEWDVHYNITVTNGTQLKILDCEWSFEGLDGATPVWIRSDEGTVLDIELCTFDGLAGSTGFYIEAFGDLYMDNTGLTGLVNNPNTGGGVSVSNSFAEFSFVELHEAASVYGLYAYNCSVNMSKCLFYDCDGTLAYFNYNDHTPYAEYEVNIIESEFHDAVTYGIWASNLFNNGNITLNMFKVKIYNIAVYGIYLEDGPKTYGAGPDAGYGSFLVTMDELELYNVLDQAMWLVSDGKSTGPADLGFFNISILNSHIHNIKNTGLYDIRYYTISKHTLLCENTVFEDIAMDPTYNRLSAIFIWRYGSVGGGWDNYYIGNCTFRRCNPGGIWFWDHGQGAFGVGGINRDFHIYNTTFTECTQAAINRVNDEGGEPGEFLVENCTFIDNGGYGILIDHATRGSGYYGMTSPHSIILVNNTTFTHHGNSALAVISNSVDQAHEIGFILENCTIDHAQGYGIEMRPTNPKGMLYLHMNNTRVNDTMGLFVFYDKEYAATAAIDVRITNSTIENSVLSALLVRAQSTLAPEAHVLVQDTTIRNAGRDGLNIYTGSPTGGATAVVGSVLVERVTIENVDGVGIKITNDLQQAPGTRTFYINDTTIWTAQQGVIIMGYQGDMWNDVVKDTLLEDLKVSYNRVNTYYCDFTTVDTQKFKATMGGEIYQYYRLTVVVKWHTGAPAIGCNVELTDNIDNLLTVQTITQPDGALPTMSMNAYIIRSTGLFSTTPYNIKATCSQVSKQTAVRLDRNKSVLITMRDDIMPEVFIHFPKDGHAQQSTTLFVRGSAWDYQSGIERVELSLDGNNWEVASGTLRWTHTFTVSDELINATSGMFNLRARAVDYAGNSRTTYVFVNIDPTPPNLLINFPYDGYITNNPRCLVRGVTEPGSVVSVNGLRAGVLVSMYTCEVTLMEGVNTLTIIAIDPMGNIHVVRVSITLDTQKPYFQLISPVEGAMTNSATFMVTAQLEGELEVTINDIPVPYGSDEYPADAGTLEFPLPLTGTENIVHIVARDSAGNVLTIDRLVLLDDVAPWIRVTSPTDGETVGEKEITVVGTTEATARFYLNDEDVTLVNGYFERTILGVEGENRIHLVSIDTAGNVNTQVVIVYLDTRPPHIAVTSPGTKVSTVNTPTMNITGTVMENGVVTTDSFLLNGVAYPLTDPVAGTFSVPVELVDGRNVITLEVEDAVGNKANLTIVVWLDTTPPTLAVTFDPTTMSGSVMTAPSITVNVSGYTDPGSVVYVNGVLVLVTPDGTFHMICPLKVTGETSIVIRSEDLAGNTRTVEQSINYAPVTTKVQEASDKGETYLVVSIVVLVLVAVIAFALMRMRGGKPQRVEATDTALVVDIEDAGPEDAKPKTPKPEAQTRMAPRNAATATARPVRPQVRRTVKVRPQTATAPAPRVGERTLSDQGAELDMVADDIEQGGS